MKTFRDFMDEAEWATFNMWLESKGFKSEVEKRKKKKKNKATNKWKVKVDKLQKSGGALWSGLEEVE